ncbi:bridging integrator 2a [Gouania willdenowi]|uniref:bridging integrator 2a n=1 Tax=Gouania willdenowi TaxID=441366 RepID=UPI0010544894|nr:bridging integrator 2 [Gouania willdenowi]
MSDSPKGSNEFTRRVQRQLSRGKERMMQRLGKSSETRDEHFERCLQMFNDQQTDGSRIYKDMRNYVDAVRDMREASRRLFQSLFDGYESDWVGEEDLGAIVEGEDLLWNDYEVKLVDQAVRTMESYVAQFPDVREKIAKRGRKLVDYDCSLHHLEALRNAKKRDDVKILKAEEERNAAKSVYEGINNELKEELPVLFDNRVGCYVGVFSAMSNLRDIFYKEMSTLNLDLQNVIKELQAQHPDKVFAVRGMHRYGSLKRRTLLSPKAWKSSFSDFHRSYSPRVGQRSSFKARNSSSSSLSRDNTTRSGSSQSVPLENLLSESRDEEEEDQSSAPPEDPPSGGAKLEEEKEDEGLKEKEKEDGDGDEDKDGGEKALQSDSSSELNQSCDSESLEMQLSAVDTLHIDEDEDQSLTELHHTHRSEVMENGDVSALSSDITDQALPLKAVPADLDPKGTMDESHRN